MATICLDWALPWPLTLVFFYDQMPPMESLPCSIVVVEQQMIKWREMKRVSGLKWCISFSFSFVPLFFVSV